MERYKKLAQAGKAAAEAGGHVMGAFKHSRHLLGMHGEGVEIASISECVDCGLHVRTSTNPHSDDPEIGGEAILSLCDSRLNPRYQNMK